MGMSVVITGDPANGYDIYGPFNNGDEAGDWASEALDGNDWWVLPLMAPDER